MTKELKTFRDGNELITPFTYSVDKNKPLDDYPRPQFVRENWTNLNGIWDFSKTKIECNTAPFEKKITVPFAPECYLSGLEMHIREFEKIWYRRQFLYKKTDKRTILHFGAVDYHCEVYINSAFVGEHVGGYNTFSFDITRFLVDGENTIVVCCYDPTDSGHQQRGKQSHKPHGIFYTGTSGIWQTVWLETIENDFISSVKFTPDIDNSIIEITPRTASAGEVSVTIFDGETEKKTTVLKNNEINFVKLDDFECWSPENPRLYDCTFTLTLDGKITDTVKSYFAMRKFSMGLDEKGCPRLLLNNKVYFQTGLLDQGYWSDGGMTAPTDEALIYDIQKCKDLGFNMLRKHIKVEPDRWYYHCDRLGMIVWQDMVSGGKELDLWHAGVLPNIQNVFIPLGSPSLKDNKYKIFDRYSPESRDEFRVQLLEMIDNHYNFPCIAAWVPFNEGWGQFDAKEICTLVRKKDPTRFVDHASGWYDQGVGDFRSIHRYILPVQIPKREKNRAFVLSEFGGYSCIFKHHVFDESKSFGYQMYKNSDALTKAFVKLYVVQIIRNVKKGLSACVYTQLSDVEYEVNGIFTFDRQKVKIDEKEVLLMNKLLKETNSSIKIVEKIEPRL